MSGPESYPPPGQPPVGGQQGGGFYPPPGVEPPASVPGGYPGAPPAQAPWSPTGYGVPAQVGAAHKPGAIPLRPLGLGDIYDAAFKIIRFNPKATVGSSVIVTAAAMLVPVLITGVISFTAGISTFDPDNPQTDDLVGLMSAYGSILLGFVLSSVGMIMVTGMNAHVALAAAIGRRLGLGEAWAATRGKRWRLLGLTLLVGLGVIVLAALVVLAIVVVGQLLGTVSAVLGGLALGFGGLGLIVWVWIRVFYLAVPPLMLETVGVFGAFGRAFRLTRSQFWRTFGIALLTFVITQLAGGILSSPINLAGEFVLAADPGGLGVFWFVLANAVGSVLAAAIISPFTTTVTSLQYIDQRIRKEAFDLELMTRAGILTS